MTKIQAHRGASKERPENTMAAFRRAEELHADGIEMDVHLLADGNLAVHHDDRLGRTVVEGSGSIYGYTFEQLRAFSAGLGFSEEYRSEKVPSFRELLEFLKGNQIVLNVEIKAGTGFLTGVEDAVIAMLREYHMEDRCIISSFNHFVLKNIKERYPEFAVGALYSVTLGKDMADYAASWGCDALHADYHLVDQALVDKAHSLGIAVNVWTVDGEEDINRMLAFGVDNIISNDAALALKLRDAFAQR
ncbi:MAG: glycerophosphodiester phosphodiesterase [Candidatus Merdivicinus sp.]|jgi:glycerophosphoryl diester phosphodiesterase